jgi:hypothetical protein
LHQTPESSPSVRPDDLVAHDRAGLLYRGFVVFLALSYGAVLAGLPMAGITDRDNYLAYGEHSWDRFLAYLDQGLPPLLSNEPLWLLINAGLGRLFPPDHVVRIIIFVSASLFSYLVLRRRPGYFGWLLLFLLFPQVLKNYVIHLRQGTAAAVFLLGWFSSRRTLGNALVLAAPFIHSSFFAVDAILFTAWGLRKLSFAADIRSFVFALAGLGASLSTAYLAGAIGARQAETYAFTGPNVSGFGFVFWAFIFALTCLQGRGFLRRHAFESGVILFYLATYFFLDVAARIFESVLVLALLSGLDLTDWRRRWFLAAFAADFIFQWAVRLGQPLMGFGSP